MGSWLVVADKFAADQRHALSAEELQHCHLHHVFNSMSLPQHYSYDILYASRRLILEQYMNYGRRSGPQCVFSVQRAQEEV